MRWEYDFTGGVRGKYAVRYAKGIEIDPDLVGLLGQRAKKERTTVGRLANGLLRQYLKKLDL